MTERKDSKIVTSGLLIKGGRKMTKSKLLAGSYASKKRKEWKKEKKRSNRKINLPYTIRNNNSNNPELLTTYAEAGRTLIGKIVLLLYEHGNRDCAYFPSTHFTHNIDMNCVLRVEWLLVLCATRWPSQQGLARHTLTLTRRCQPWRYASMIVGECFCAALRHAL